MATRQQVAGRSEVIIRVGASSSAATDTSTSCGVGELHSNRPTAQINTSTPAAQPTVAAADDAGRHDNPSQQPADDKRSAVCITNAHRHVRQSLHGN